MTKLLTRLNIVFFIELLFVVLIAVGVMPREGALFLAFFLSAVFAFIFSLEESVFLTARSIPLFLALPITESFDNFNIWRIFILILFVKFLLKARIIYFENIAKALGKFGSLASGNSGRSEATVTALNFPEDKRPEFSRFWSTFEKGITRAFLKQFRLELLVGTLAFIAVLSLLKAEDPIAGVKRIIYFANMGMLFFVIRYIVNRGNFMRLGKNFIFSGIIISVIGIIQLIFAYLMPINNFSEYWAFVIEKNLYGNGWSQIAISANTWFAYFNNTIHLRMFSWFPDSHSFPLYLLIASTFISSFIATLSKTKNDHIQQSSTEKKHSDVYYLFKKVWGFIAFKRSVSTPCKPSYIILGGFSLCLVLSGTRGIWAAAIAPISIIAFYYLKKIYPKEVIIKLSLPIIFFIVALLISQPIFNSKQFKLTENQSAQENILANRLISIFNAEETSNQGRIQIWKESLKSIVKNPFLGVGIGNFPTVLKQDISLTKAGSSAHNLFLQILAEMGIFAFIVFLAIIYEIYKKARGLATQINTGRFNLGGSEVEPLLKFFGLFSILYISWILAYTMTDPAIFDERVFLALMILIGTIFALNRELQITKIKIRN